MAALKYRNAFRMYSPRGFLLWLPSAWQGWCVDPVGEWVSCPLVYYRVQSTHNKLIPKGSICMAVVFSAHSLEFDYTGILHIYKLLLPSSVDGFLLLASKDVAGKFKILLVRNTDLLIFTLPKINFGPVPKTKIHVNNCCVRLCNILAAESLKYWRSPGHIMMYFELPCSGAPKIMSSLHRRDPVYEHVDRRNTMVKHVG